MNLLAIDTSTELASVALLYNGRLASREQGAQRQHAQLLLPMIEELLTSAGIELKQLDGIVFGEGPGSFTGLRIACSIAKGLAYAANLPLYPVSSLLAIASQENIQEGTAVLSVIDARMNQLYWGYYFLSSPESNLSFPDSNLSSPRRRGSIPESDEKPTSRWIPACAGTTGVSIVVTDAADIPALADKKIILAGVGYEAYLSSFKPALAQAIVSQQTIYPKAEAMIHLVTNGCINPMTAAEAQPMYIRNQIVQGESRG